MHPFWNGPMGWGGGFLMWIWFVAVIALIVWLILRSDGQRARRLGPPETPEQIVKRRYASGEIDRAAYERMLEDLRR
ncbi:MAG: SHOCT domain-containing protein [Candidatus Eisenbacteria bacterium]